MDAQRAKGIQIGDRSEQVNIFHSRRPVPVPRQLPPDVSHFTGRQVDLAKLDDLLGQMSSGQPTTMVISAVAGAAGVGKTALAVHWAHRIRARFPDGDLYTNLRGYDPGPIASPAQVIDGFLRAFDIAPDSIAADLDAQTAQLRSLLHGRRVLIVLDNARNPEQVRPLLPNSPGSLVLVTSRSDLPGLAAHDGAQRMTLDILAPAEALDLFSKIIGPDRVAAEPQAAADLARRCDYLPLALRIAAELAVAGPRTPLVNIVAELERLDAFALDDDDERTTVRSVFSWSYGALRADAARAFRLLGLHAGADFNTEAAAALIDDPAAARRLLSALTGTHLLAETGPGRFRFHDLLRAYAAECAGRDETDEQRAAAKHRSCRWYLQRAETAAVILDRARRPAVRPPEAAEPGGSAATHAEAMHWFDTELDNLIAAARQAADLIDYTTAVDIVSAARSYFQLSMNIAAWTTMADIGLAAARQAGDRLAEANMLSYRVYATTYSNRVHAANYSNRFTEALDLAARVVEIRRDLGQVRAMDIVNLGGQLSHHADRQEDAVRLLHQGLALAAETGEQHATGHALEHLSRIYRQRGDFDTALRHAQQSFVVFRNADISQGVMFGLASMASAYLELDRIDEAIQSATAALTIAVQNVDRTGQADALSHIAIALQRGGHTEAADLHWHQALELYDTLGTTRDELAWLRANLSAAANVEAVNLLQNRNSTRSADR